MREIFEAFERAGKELFLVGGAVRDLALGESFESLDDLDFCTNALPEQTLEILKRERLTTYDVGIEFGTVGTLLSGPKAQGYPKDCQITTYRSAEYYRRGSRHPEVRYGKTILDDLRRRDFSINSIAMDKDGHFVDPYEGLKDLKAGVLRVVSDPLETLAEDPLRILRVGRFISKLGFKPDAALTAAAAERAECILDISRERWLLEMTKLLKGPYASEGLEFLHEVKILGVILPEVAWLANNHGESWALTLKTLAKVPPVDGPRWATLLHQISSPWVIKATQDVDGVSYRQDQHSALLCDGIAKRFKFDNKLGDEVSGIIERYRGLLYLEQGLDDAQVRRLVRGLDPYLEGAMMLAKALATPTQLERLEAVAQRAQALEAQGQLRVQLPSGIGKALMERFKLKPGPRVGELKGALDDLVLDGILANGQDSDYYVSYLEQNPPEFLD